MQQVAENSGYKVHCIGAACALDLPFSMSAMLITLKSLDGTCSSHAITVLGGRIFDWAEPEPLELTRENLTRVMGVEYGSITRGYLLEPRATPVPGGSRKARRRANKRMHAGGAH